MLLYVDDMLIAAKNMSEVDKLKAQLKQEFEMKDLGAAKKILGIKIIGIDKKKNCSYLKEIHRESAGQIWRARAKPVKTPFAAHFQLSTDLSPQTDEEKKYISRVPYEIT